MERYPSYRLTSGFDLPRPIRTSDQPKVHLRPFGCVSPEIPIEELQCAVKIGLTGEVLQIISSDGSLPTSFGDIAKTRGEIARELHEKYGVDPNILENMVDDLSDHERVVVISIWDDVWREEYVGLLTVPENPEPFNQKIEYTIRIVRGK